jgi:hypothetical protein
MKNCWRRLFLCGPCRIKGKSAIDFSQNLLLNFEFSFPKSPGEEMPPPPFRRPCVQPCIHSPRNRKWFLAQSQRLTTTPQEMDTNKTTSCGLDVLSLLRVSRPIDRWFDFTPPVSTLRSSEALSSVFVFVQNGFLYKVNAFMFCDVENALKRFTYNITRQCWICDHLLACKVS